MKDFMTVILKTQKKWINSLKHWNNTKFAEDIQSVVENLPIN